MDANHLRFNQSDGSVSLIIQTGFLAKNQLPSICPDPIVIPCLAQTCKRERLDRLLCPIRALKLYLKMTSSYCQNRTKSFLPFKGNHGISKASVWRWVSYTVKLAYRKLTRRDISFLKIKAHEVGHYLLLGHSLIRFRSMKYSKQQYGISLLLLLNSIWETCLNKQLIFLLWAQ